MKSESWKLDTTPLSAGERRERRLGGGEKLMATFNVNSRGPIC